MNEDAFRQHVRDIVADTRGSAGALARKHGLHPKVLTLFLSGARGPSPEVCAAFGYERQYHPITPTPVAQGDEVRDALEPFARAAKNIPAKFADDRPVKAAIELTPDEAKAYRDVVSAQLIVSFDGISAGDFRNALATLTKGARDAG